MTLREENHTLAVKNLELDCLIKFKQMYPLPFLIHLTVTPPKYAIEGSVHKATNFDATGFTPYFPDKHSKINMWIIDYILNPLEQYFERKHPGFKFYGVTVIVPRQSGKPQHAHLALCCAGATKDSASITTALKQLEINRHSENDDKQFSYTATTVYAEDIYPGTVPYLITKNFYLDNIVSTLHHYNRQLFPKF